MIRARCAPVSTKHERRQNIVQTARPTRSRLLFHTPRHILRPKHSEHLSWRTRTTWFKHQSAACYPMLPELCHAACAAQALVYAALKKGEENLKKSFIASAVCLPYDGRFSRRRALF